MPLPNSAFSALISAWPLSSPNVPSCLTQAFMIQYILVKDQNGAGYHPPLNACGKSMINSVLPFFMGITTLCIEPVYLLGHLNLRHRRISLLRHRSVDAISLLFQILPQIRQASFVLLLPLPPTVARPRMLLLVELP